MSEATSNAPLTVVLVHGAFADSSSWDGVIERLQAAGIQVTAAPNPLRGISHDSAYVASFMRQVPGPVLAVGHSYGGAVISNAATELGNVVGLVFVAAFAPDEGERLGEVTAGSRDSVLGTAQVALQYPTPDGAGTATEFAIDPAKLHDVFAADLPAEQAAVAGRDPAAGLRAGLHRAVRAARLEVAAVLDGGRDRRQGGRHGRGPLDGRARRRHHHRGRRLARDHDLPARRRRRRHQDRGGRGQSPGRRHGGLADYAGWAREVTTIAVVGATGRVGSEIVRGVLARGDAVTALVRDPDKARRAFGEPDGLHVRRTHLDDPRDLTEAFDGIRTVFIAMGSVGIEGALQRIAINAAARISSIDQVTRLSVLNTSADSLGINQRAHYSIDQFASSTAVPYSTIRPAIFSASLLAAAQEVRDSRTWTGLAGSGRMALIDHRDAAEAGLRVLTDPALWGAHHDLTGPVPISWPGGARAAFGGTRRARQLPGRGRARTPRAPHRRRGTGGDG